MQRKLGFCNFLSLTLLDRTEKENWLCSYASYISFCCCEREEERMKGRKGREGKEEMGPLFNQLGIIFKIEKLSWLVECYKWRNTLVVWKNKIFITRIVQQEIWEEGIGFWFLSPFIYTHQLDVIEQKI